MAPSLNRDDWVAAALAALMEDGPEGIAVQPLARTLGATKGSFYWHFANRDDLLTATLAEWERQHTTAVIEEVRAMDASAPEQLGALFATITKSALAHHGEARLLVTSGHPVISPAIAEVTEHRITFIAELLVSSGLEAEEARRRAVVAYSAYLGFAQLAVTAPDSLPVGAERVQLRQDLLRSALHDVDLAARGRSVGSLVAETRSRLRFDRRRSS